MPYVSLDANVLKVGDPITSDILNTIKDNEDYLESQINQILTAVGTIQILNGDISFVGYSSLEPDIFYFKARQNFAVNDFRVQLFSKQGITSGTLSFDLQKSNDTNDANFTSILSSNLSFNFLSDADYSQQVALINASLNNITTDQVLRVKVINKPAAFNGKVLMSISGQ